MKIIRMDYGRNKYRKEEAWEVHFDHGMHYDAPSKMMARHVRAYVNKRLLFALIKGIWSEFWREHGKKKATN